MTRIETDRPQVTWKVVFRWVTYIGFWWSLLALLYSMRTPKLALEKLAEWIEMIQWALAPLYYAWSILSDVFVSLTAPIYELLSIELSPEVRDAISFGFFLGLRVLPTGVKWWVSTEDKRPDWVHFLGMMGGLYFVMMGLPYLLACDHAGAWLSLNNAQVWIFGFAFEITLAAGMLIWLAVDPFEFVSGSREARESPDD
jgi:hypothetical protein